MLNRLLSLCPAVFFFALYFLFIYQQASNAQTLEDDTESGLSQD
jgi:hypothetical protein